MSIRIEAAHLDEVVVLVPDVHEDERGFFLETFRADQFRELGLPGQFVQENHSGSRKGVVRGLHFQWDPPMGKLMRVTAGSAFLVAADIRTDSATLGKWFGIEASTQNRVQVWAPAGFARGFCALSDWAEIQYLCTAVYNPEGEGAIRWNDPDIGIRWPVANPLLSAKDAVAQTLSQWLASPNASRLSYP